MKHLLQKGFKFPSALGLGVRSKELFALAVFSFVAVAGIAQSSRSSVTTITKPVKVEIRKVDNRYQLFRDGQPYFVKGAGGSSYPDRIAAYFDKY